jgi:hypothetical protein
MKQVWKVIPSLLLILCNDKNTENGAQRSKDSRNSIWPHFYTNKSPIIYDTCSNNLIETLTINRNTQHYFGYVPVNKQIMPMKYLRLIEEQLKYLMLHKRTHIYLLQNSI